MKKIDIVKAKRMTQNIWPIIRMVLVVGIAFMILYPLFVKFSTSIKSDADMHDPTVFFIPKNPTLGNFRTVIQSVSYLSTMFKTILFVGCVALMQLASCTLTAYGFARFRFPGRNFLFALVVFTLVIPPQAILLPLYLKFRFFNVLEIFKFGGTLSGIALTDTIWPFVLLSITAVAFKNGLYIFMLRQHFYNIPASLEEAAYIDGCGVFKTFYRIILPGAIPMLITVFLFAFVWQWNDFYYTQMLAPSLPTLNVKLAGMTLSGWDSAAGSMMGSMLQAPKFLLLIAPLVVLYLFTQRFFTESVERSGLVG